MKFSVPEVLKTRLYLLCLTDRRCEDGDLTDDTPTFVLTGKDIILQQWLSDSVTTFGKGGEESGYYRVDNTFSPNLSTLKADLIRLDLSEFFLKLFQPRPE